jgi:hypothetical protein
MDLELSTRGAQRLAVAHEFQNWLDILGARCALLSVGRGR